MLKQSGALAFLHKHYHTTPIQEILDILLDVAPPTCHPYRPMHMHWYRRQTNDWVGEEFNVLWLLVHMRVVPPGGEGYLLGTSDLP